MPARMPAETSVKASAKVPATGPASTEVRTQPATGAGHSPGTSAGRDVAPGLVAGTLVGRVAGRSVGRAGGGGKSSGPGRGVDGTGPYEIVSELGRGGFGIVYEAQVPGADDRVAIKEYLPAHLGWRVDGRTVVARSLGTGEGAFELGLRGFLDEARLLARHRHPGLIHVLGSWRENGTAYLAMPFHAGLTLLRLVQSEHRQIDQAWLMRMLEPLLGALELLHADGCFHRDIAPDNILIPDAGGAVLLDLGAARHLIADHARAQTVMLKPGFAPIEQYANDPSLVQGPWTDVYGLGAVLHFAITARTPVASAARAMRDSLPRLVDLAPAGYSTAFLAVVDQCLAIRPEDRPASMTVLREALIGAGPSVRSAALAGSRLAAASEAPVAGAVPAETAVVTPVMTPVMTPIATSIATPGGADSGASPDSAVPPDRATGRTLRSDARAAEVPASGPEARSHAVLTPSSIGSLPRTGRKRGPGPRLAVVGLIIAVGLGSAWLAGSGLSASSPEDGAGVGLGASAVVRVPMPAEPESSAEAPAAPSVSSESSVAPARALRSGPSAVDSGVSPDSAAAQAAGAVDPGPTVATHPAPGVGAAGGAASTSTRTPGATDVPEALAPAQGRLAIAVRPWAEIYVDGRLRGISPPRTSLTLPVGSHVIELRNPGAPSLRAEIEIREGRTTSLQHRF